MEACFGVMHERRAVLKVRNRVADRPVTGGISRVAHAGVLQRFDNAPRTTRLIEQPRFPTPERAGPRVLSALEQACCGSDVFQRVPRIDQFDRFDAARSRVEMLGEQPPNFGRAIGEQDHRASCDGSPDACRARGCWLRRAYAHNESCAERFLPHRAPSPSRSKPCDSCAESWRAAAARAVWLRSRLPEFERRARVRTCAAFRPMASPQ